MSNYSEWKGINIRINSSEFFDAMNFDIFKYYKTGGEYGWLFQFYLF